MSAMQTSGATNSCGCCEGTEGITPVSTANRPSLDALRYRVGTHASFLGTMVARLSSQDYPALRDLTTRQPSDPAIALLDAWATVADVLTFYNERIANEGYLRTATERRSLLELARLVGYAPRPGVAATAYLAYTLDENSEDEVVIPAGARVQSVPAPGELPQTFETSAALQARARWNNLRPQLSQPQTKTSIQTSPAANGRVYLEGINTNLKANDMLLIDFDPATDPKVDPIPYRIVDVQPDPLANRTKVLLSEWQSAQPNTYYKSTNTSTSKSSASRINPVGDLLEPLTKPPSRQPASELYLERNLTYILSGAADAPLQLLRTFQPRLHNTLSTALANVQATPPNAIRVYTPRIKAPLFGYNAQKKQKLEQNPPTNENPIAVTETVVIGEWPMLRDTYTFPIEYPAQVERFASKLDNCKLDDDLRTEFQKNGHYLSHKPSVRVVTATQRWIIEDNNRCYFINSNKDGTTIYSLDVHIAKFTEEARAVYLDIAYDRVLPGSWVVIDSTAVSQNEPVQVTPSKEMIISKVIASEAGIRRAEYGMNGKSTRIVLCDDWITTKCDYYNVVDPQSLADEDFQVIRHTAVYAQFEELPLAEEPLETDICSGKNDAIALDGLYDNLQSGRWMIVSGERTDVEGTSGVKASELVMLSAVIHDVKPPVVNQEPTINVVSNNNLNGNGERANGDDRVCVEPSKASEGLPGEKKRTYLQLATPLAYHYKRDTVTIYGNVVKATHGETRNEVLGSGDGSKVFQAFSLKQSPLTYVPAVTATGVESSLEVRVNDVQWHEVASQTLLGPNDRSFITKTDDDGKTTVIFGNGLQGLRPPTGVENIKARYRSGIGKVGNLKAGQLSLLMTRPLGVKDVINPQPATGGADRENRDQIRQNAPLALAALDRLVSVRDYADFARTFAGIGKASATRLSNGQRQLVHVTIAGADDIPIDESSDLFTALRRALQDFGDPHQPFQLAVRELLAILLGVNIRVLPDYEWETVAPKIRATLLDAFGFERRELGQDVLLSEAISLIQNVAGVAYVDVDTFDAVSQTMLQEFLSQPEQNRVDLLTYLATHRTSTTDKQPLSRISVGMAHIDNAQATGIAPAQLAILTPDVPDTLILTPI